MNTQTIDLASLPITTSVAKDLKNIFASEDVDLRDVTNIAFQDPVVLINIIVLVNKSFKKMDRPVVNTLTAAINLLGVPVLSKSLLSLKSVDELNLSSRQVGLFNIIRNRTYVAAHMTKFWADYMGENNSEEQFCVSMFTGAKDLYQYVVMEQGVRQEHGRSYLDSIEDLKHLYSFDEASLSKLPDSIQQIYTHSSYTRRLSLSILSYELVAALELGYSSEIFNEKLSLAVDCFDQSVSRAAYDFSIQLVELERNSVYGSYHHSGFLLGSNLEEVDPLSQ